MTQLDVGRTELREFTAGVQAGAARSLVLLRAIDTTLSWLQRLTGNLHSDAVFAEKAITGLTRITTEIDPDDSIKDALLVAQEQVSSLYDLLIDKRQSGRNDGRLTEEDGIEAAYTEAIGMAADLQNAINQLRCNIDEHDADVEIHPGDSSLVGSTPDEIEAIFHKLVG